MSGNSGNTSNIMDDQTLDALRNLELSGQCRLESDWYKEPDDVLRGVSMPADLQLPSSSQGFNPSDCCSQLDGYLKEWSTSSDNQHMHSGLLESGTELVEELDLLGDGAWEEVGMQDRFLNTIKPPKLPSDIFFKLENTTYYVSGKPAFVISNHMLDFLCNDVVSASIKVNKEEYSMEAQVFVKNVMVTLQVSVYSCDSEQFAVEFQRLSGDILTFHAVYQKASRFLKLLPGIEMNGGPQASSEVALECPTEFPPGASLASEVDLTPLYDMASLIQLPALQSEAAVMLATMAEDVALAAKLCNTSTFDAISKLLQTDTPEVAYPTSRLILCLVQQAEAARFFGVSLLTMIIDTVLRTSSALVQQTLAQAFKLAMQHQASPSVQVVALESTLDAALAKQGKTVFS